MSYKVFTESTEQERERPYRTEFPAADNSRNLDFRFYISVLRKHKWPIVLTSAIVTAVAGLYAYTATPIYAAHSTLLIESQKANIISIEDLVTSEQESLDYFGTQFVMLRSRGLAERVTRKLQLDRQEAQDALVVAPAAPEGLQSVLSEVSKKSQQVVSKIRQLLGMPDNSINIESDQDLSPKTESAEENSVGEPPGVMSDVEFDRLVNRFRQSLHVNPLKNTKLVKITYLSPDPKFAALAANTVANEYIASVLDSRKEIKEQASQWMSGRIDELKEKLDESEQALQAFKVENDLIELNGGVGRLNEQELLLATAELAGAKSDLSDARDLFREVEKLKDSAPHLLETFPAVQNDLLVRSVKIEYGQRLRELNELKNRYGDKHPKIVDAQSRLDTLRSTLDGHIERLVSSIESDYQLQQQRVAALESSLKRGKEDIQVIGQKKIILEALEREVATNRDQYNRLFNRITETRTADGLDAANAVLAEEALVPGGPFKPNKKLILGLAFLGSFALTAALAFLYEFLNDTVKSADDVTRRLGTKLMGVLPLVEKGYFERKSKLPLSPFEAANKKGTFVEAVNTCRTALSMNEGAGFQVILVTSSLPDEGKSTAALNLAYSFGQLERTLLIDCDMRRPSLAKALGLPQDISGLSNLLMQTSSAEDCLRRNVMESFDCLPSGPIPDQPLEMLASARFAKILEELRQHYDKIVIDSAPTHAVSDALVLSKLSDTVLYVVKSHVTKIGLIQTGLARLSEVGAKVAGVWMSQVDVDKLASYGGFEFHGFYDYYGYTDKTNKNAKVKLTPEEMRKMRSVDSHSALDLDFYNRMPTLDITDGFSIDVDRVGQKRA